MQYAKSPLGERINAAKGLSANCPQCSAKVIPKCGELVIHHWAHEADYDCDPWWEHESEWHRSWKALAKPERTEVTLGNHRADIVRSDGTVVELQHSTISPEEIAERERFYKKMIWLFDGTDINDESWRLMLRPKLASLPSDVTFRFKHPRKHYGVCRAPVYVHLGHDPFTYEGKKYDGDFVLHLKRLYLDRPPYGGYGVLGYAEAFRVWVAV